MFPILFCGGLSFFASIHFLAPVSIDYNSISTSHPMKVMSFNIRYDNPGDGDNTWSKRLDRVVSVIETEAPDILGVQEALSGQVENLEEFLTDYGWFGVGRDDGISSGEFSPIFYRTERFEFLRGGTFWLSSNPDQPGSIGWDAAITRIATWINLKDRTSNVSFFHFNTHFDHRGVKARENSALLLRRKIHSIAGTSPVVVTGDFNFQPQDTAYSHLTASPAGPTPAKLHDAAVLTSTGDDEQAGTCCGFFTTDDHSRRIDYILVNDYFEVREYHVNSVRSGNVFSSDHLPVVSTITPKKK